MTFTPRTHDNGNPCCSAYDATTGEPIRPPTLCTLCEAHFATLESAELRTAERSTTHSYTPAPDGYVGGIRKMRAAAGLTEHDAAVAAQHKAIEAAAAAIAEENAAAFRALGHVDLSAYRAPDPYREGLAKLRSAKR